MHVYQGTLDTIGERLDGEWDRWAAEIAVTVRETTAARKTDLPAFAPHVGPRGADDPDPILTAAYLDLDALADDAALAALLAEVRVLDCLVHTTSSDGGPGTSPRKVRLWARIDRLIQPWESAPFRLALAAELGVTTDPFALDAKRIGFAGRITGTEARTVWRFQGAPVPVDQILPPTPAPAPAPRTAPTAYGGDAAWIPAAVAALEPLATMGQRHRLAVGVGGYCRTRGIPPEQAVELIRALPTDDPDRQERTVLDAYAKSRVAGWSILAELGAGVAVEIAIPNRAHERVAAEAAERRALDGAPVPALAPVDTEALFDDRTMGPILNLHVRQLAGCPSLYERGGRIVEVLRSDPLRIQDTTGLRFVEICENVIGEHAAKTAGKIAARGFWPGMRPLDGILESPALRPDGTVIDRDGYDDQTRSFVRLGIHPVVGSDPAAALADLRELVRDFPFVSETDFAAWVCAMLTPLARPALTGPAPMFLFAANTYGAGKTLLPKLAGRISTGEDIAAQALPVTKEERDKTFFTAFRTARPIMLVDNITSELRSDILDLSLTSMRVSGRVLGESREETIPVRTTVYASANNPDISSDLVRRTIRCALHSDQEMAWKRDDYQIKNIEAHVEAKRAQYLGAALSILVGPRTVKGAPLGGYGSWSAIVRDAVLSAGGADVVATQEDLRAESDHAGALLGTLHRAWAARFGDQRVTAAQALAGAGMVEGAPGGEQDQAARLALADVFTELLGPRKPTAVWLSRCLRRFAGQTKGSRALMSEQQDNQAVWFLRTR